MDGWVGVDVVQMNAGVGACVPAADSIPALLTALHSALCLCTGPISSFLVISDPEAAKHVLRASGGLMDGCR